jgi:hypothetical protein
MSETSYDSERVRNAAKNLGTLLDEMAVFNDLKPHWPNAGKFALAQWLERIVGDRRDAIVAHAEHLRITFEAMEVSLLGIADDFDNTDGENAVQIKDALGELKKKIEGEWDTWDTTTEEGQGNFGKGDEGDSTDGDGYNDDVNDPLH